MVSNINDAVNSSSFQNDSLINADTITDAMEVTRSNFHNLGVITEELSPIKPTIRDEIIRDVTPISDARNIDRYNNISRIGVTSEEIPRIDIKLQNGSGGDKKFSNEFFKQL